MIVEGKGIRRERTCRKEMGRGRKEMGKGKGEEEKAREWEGWRMK